MFISLFSHDCSTGAVIFYLLTVVCTDSLRAMGGNKKGAPPPSSGFEVTPEQLELTRGAFKWPDAGFRLHNIFCLLQ